MASFNKITIIGYLGRDPELRYTPQGVAVCNINVATTERRKDQRTGEPQDLTTWFRITLWRRLAELANEYLAKGKQVYIEGRLRQEEYTDRDGVKRTSLVVEAKEMQFLGPKGADDHTTSSLNDFNTMLNTSPGDVEIAPVSDPMGEGISANEAASYGEAMESAGEIGPNMSLEGGADSSIQDPGKSIDDGAIDVSPETDADVSGQPLDGQGTDKVIDDTPPVTNTTKKRGKRIRDTSATTSDLNEKTTRRRGRQGGRVTATE